MKILHTSDWHLGHTLYGYDRSEEQNEMLRQIEELVGEERPDALVVSGDIFHTGQPSNRRSQKGIRPNPWKRLSRKRRRKSRNAMRPSVQILVEQNERTATSTVRVSSGLL